ncbi:unnamed protein product [Brassicogethes aeneus]|uniref:Coiled-coil domain-containing protein 22 homolog n=1 Tax=Brassicogethes aeneus TaxID=1431903 RepID=A0A9P0FM05_BRAAE|nr:unnamed protein product [Brassicogethes aeneus]
MEEVDNIIIDSLRHMDCNIDSSIDSLKQFDAEMVVEAVSTCLEAILPGQKFTKKLPPSMSFKLKIASSLAEQIKELGFRGDMGYQTILYCNEVEIRRVLMFLIERLPRDTNKATQIEQTGYVPKLVKRIEDSLRLSFKQTWLPSSLFNNGVRHCEDDVIVQTLGNCAPLKAVNLQIPDTQNNLDEVLKEYWIRDVNDVTRQCDREKLIPSLLYNDCEFSSEESIVKMILQNSSHKSNIVNLVNADLNVMVKENTLQGCFKTTETENECEVKIKNLVKDIDEDKIKYKELQEEANKLELSLSQVLSMKNQEQDLLKDSANKVKLKTKTIAIISKEENLQKLRYLVENGTDRLVDLANQWNEVRTPLLEEFKSLQNTLTSEEIKQQEDTSKLNYLKESYKNLAKDFKEKEELEQNLIEKIKQVSKNNNRVSYTRRILEIVSNIKKQNVEIQKVLKDTREVQKEINTLSGQVERSFTLSDELIFQDAKEDETARKAYKLLAALRDECSGILKAVEDLGLSERESRNLQEQVETEKVKDIGKKLERVNQDLEQMKKETNILLKGNQ